MTAKSEPVSTELTRSIRQDLERFHRGAQLTFDREDILDVLDMYERSIANRADLATENERLRAQVAAFEDDWQKRHLGVIEDNDRLRAAAQAVIDCPLLKDSCDEWRALRDAIASEAQL